MKLADVRIPTRDGSYLLADVFRPRTPGRYPVLLRLSVYGRAFGMGSIITEDDRVASETREVNRSSSPATNWPGWCGRCRTRCQRTPPTGCRAATSASGPTSRGVGRTPGTLEPFSPQEALDYYDAMSRPPGRTLE